MRLLVMFSIVSLGSVSVFSQTTNSHKITEGPIIQVFGNFDFNTTHQANKVFGFWFGRAHFGYEHEFSSQFSGKIVIDAGRPTTVGSIEVADSVGSGLSVFNSSKEGSHYTMTLKFASLQWKPNENITIQAGGILQNHYITQEKFWGYRYLAETFQDRYFKMPSSDLGIIGYFKISPKLGIDLALSNGEGFRFDQDPYGDIKVAGGIDYYPVKSLQTRLFTHHSSSKNPQKNGDQLLFSGFVGYKYEKKFRIGGEYNFSKNHMAKGDYNLLGCSFYASYAVCENIEAFTRFDWLQAHTRETDQTISHQASTGKAYITGLHYKPVNGVYLSINYQGWEPDDRDLDFQHHFLLCFEYRL